MITPNQNRELRKSIKNYFATEIKEAQDKKLDSLHLYEMQDAMIGILNDETDLESLEDTDMTSDVHPDEEKFNVNAVLGKSPFDPDFLK